MTQQATLAFAIWLRGHLLACDTLVLVGCLNGRWSRMGAGVRTYAAALLGSLIVLAAPRPHVDPATLSVCLVFQSGESALKITEFTLELAVLLILLCL